MNLSDMKTKKFIFARVQRAMFINLKKFKMMKQIYLYLNNNLMSKVSKSKKISVNKIIINLKKRIVAKS